MHDLVVAMTGASGAIYAIRLLEVLLVAGHTVHLTISKSATIVLDRELGIHVDLRKFNISQLLPDESELASDSALQTLMPDRSALADISSVFSDCTKGKHRLSSLRGLRGRDRERFVSHERHGDLPVLDGHAGKHRRRAF